MVVRCSIHKNYPLYIRAGISAAGHENTSRANPGLTSRTEYTQALMSAAVQHSMPSWRPRSHLGAHLPRPR